jgi:hypothetical protein
MLAFRNRQRRPAPAVGADGERRAHPAGQGLAAVPRAAPEVELALIDGCAAIGPGVALLAGDRYRWSAEPTDRTGIVVVAPREPAALRSLVARHAGASVVVLDRRGAPSPRLVARSFDAGAAAYLASADLQVIIAHLDALVRRRLDARGLHLA